MFQLKDLFSKIGSEKNNKRFFLHKFWKINICYNILINKCTKMHVLDFKKYDLKQYCLFLLFILFCNIWLFTIFIINF
jgi:hypothetical protein